MPSLNESIRFLLSTRIFGNIFNISTSFFYTSINITIIISLNMCFVNGYSNYPSFLFGDIMLKRINFYLS